MVTPETSYAHTSLIRFGDLISWGENSHVDFLATLALSLSRSIPMIISVESIEFLSIGHQKDSRISAVAVCPSWIDLNVSFISNGTLLEDKKDVENIRKKYARYWLSTEKKLY